MAKHEAANIGPPLLTGRQALLLLLAIGVIIACMLATVAAVTIPEQPNVTEVQR